MLTNYASNIIIFIFFITIIGIISGIIIKDCNSMSEHLKHCEEYCYPGIVIKQFSRNSCLCQSEIEVKYPLDKE